MATPITDCLRKGKFDWGDKQESSFSTLKEKLSTTLVLAILNSSQTFEVETDASATEIVVVLCTKRATYQIFQRESQ